MTRLPPLPPLLYEEVVRRALLEDFGRAGDLTSDAVVPVETEAAGTIVARQAGRIAGLGAALAAFRLVDPRVAAIELAADGDDVAADAALAAVHGPARALLAGERTALNLLGRLCGIATATRDFVAAVAGTRARIAGTRKTTPGLRALEKYAIRCGGGASHRYGLDDAILIKDNHVLLAGGVGEAIGRAKAAVGHLVKIEAEVDDLDQLDEALAAGVDAVLLDNMQPATLRRAVERIAGRVVAEASGRVRPESVRAIAETGVDLISVGWLTHGAPSLDVAFDLDGAAPDGR